MLDVRDDYLALCYHVRIEGTAEGDSTLAHGAL
jgi:hypothetical protein